MEERELTMLKPQTSDDAIGSAFDSLIQLGKERGYLTWEKLNSVLPDEAVSPDHLETILLRLEEHKIDMLDEIEAERLEELGRKGKRTKRDADAKPTAGTDGADEVVVVDETPARRIDDPVRMYLTQMGEIPLLTRERGDPPGQEDRDHPQGLPPAGARERLLHRSRRSRSSQQVARRATCPSTAP